MTDAIDPLARMLAQLRADGRVASSRLPDSAVQRIRPLLEAGVVVERRSGAGRALILLDRDALNAFIEVHFPGGLSWDSVRRDRAGAVRQARNSKRSGTQCAVVSMIGRAGKFMVGGKELDIADATKAFGCCSVMVDAESGGQLAGIARVGIVENADVFGLSLTIDGIPDVVLYAGGRIKADVLRWLLRVLPNSVGVEHMGDFDLVGLSEFMRVRSVFGRRARLWVPANLSDLFRYGNPKLFEKQDRSHLTEYLADVDPSVRMVAELIQRTGSCLEQEILVPTGAHHRCDVTP